MWVAQRHARNNANTGQALLSGEDTTVSELKFSSGVSGHRGVRILTGTALTYLSIYTCITKIKAIDIVETLC